MNILITGGAGYIGTELITYLSDHDDVNRITIYDNLSKGNHNLFLMPKIPKPHKVSFVLGELLDSRKLKKIIKSTDVVYHLAAKVTTPFANRDPHFFEQVNNWGTAELVYAVEKSDVSKFIFTSSTSIYGASKKLANELREPNPRTFYGISKMRGEEHVQRLFDKLDAYILRCGNVYGYGSNLRFDAVINRFMFDANFNKQITIHGSGKQHRPFIHINLLTKVLTDICFEKVPSGTYNVVDRNLQILDIVDVLKEIYPHLEYLFINQHLELRELMVETDSKLREYLDYTNKRALNEELRDFKGRFSF